MNDNIAIKINNLSKHYKLYDNHTDRFKEALHPFRKIYHKNYKALDNINFEIKKGEAVGIIGRNGAGKSTLLKIITGVLTQTNGEVQVNGRIASLLELGAGFNPELTGYENIYFNASLLGLTDNEIDSKIDSIISFADIGEYIYQPVKTYSSGMFVRLAFAVISHVDADILIIDEALAVGDALFVQKCMSFIRNFIKDKTLLFVSHDNSAVIDLCSKAIYLDKGIVKYQGVSKDVCDSYIHSILQINNNIEDIIEPEPLLENITNTNEAYEISVTNNIINSSSFTTGLGEIFSIVLENCNNKNKKNFQAGDTANLQIKAKIFKDINNPILGFLVLDRKGRELFGDNTYSITENNNYFVNIDNILSASFTFKLPMLQNGEYVIMCALSSGNPYEHTHHHYVHEGIILNILHEQLVFGLVGIDIIDKELIKE